MLLVRIVIKSLVLNTAVQSGYCVKYSSWLG